VSARSALKQWRLPIKCRIEALAANFPCSTKDTQEHFKETVGSNSKAGKVKAACPHPTPPLDSQSWEIVRDGAHHPIGRNSIPRAEDVNPKDFAISVSAASSQ
jgi:hypothetical protein